MTDRGEAIRKAILLMEERLPASIRKEGAIRDLYMWLRKGRPPKMGFIPARKPRKHDRRPKPRGKIIVTSKYIRRRFGIAA